MPKNSSPNDEYVPAEDTFLLADNIQNMSGTMALDVGSGSGYLTKILAENFMLVVGTDIDHDILKNQTYKTDNLVCCNGADALRSDFDLVVCNLPYLATDEILDAATDGGEGGFEIPHRILDSICGIIGESGKILFVTSSLSDFQKLIDYAEQIGLRCMISARKKLFFEELLLVEATKAAVSPS